MGTHGFARSISILAAAFGTLLATTGQLVAQRGVSPRYSITDLGTLGGISSEASAVNNFGDVVGAAATDGGRSHAFLYRTGQLFDLGTLPGGTTSFATAINDRGDIAGYSGINAYGPQFKEAVQGFVWREGVMRAVGALYCPCSFNDRYGTSRAFAISSAGWVVGDSETRFGEAFRHAFAWQENVMMDLGSALDRRNSYAYGINDINEVVGVANERAFLLRNGAAQDLGALPGHTTSAARAINNKGQIVGASTRADGVSRAFIWDGTLSDLGTLPGDSSSEARAINVYGDVVGRSGAPGFSSSRAVLWRSGTAVDLNTIAAAPGWLLSNATAISDMGHIVGVGVHQGQVRAFLLTP
jgi:probable HAF family extracellular repeat protein